MNTCKFLVAIALAVTMQFTFVTSTAYTVGAPGGLWDLKTDYTKWVSNITFYPDDNLIFSYAASAHDVWEVTKSDYETCTIGTPLNKYTGGNNVITLTETGSKYFYCSVGSHCSSGMKLEVLVVSDSPPSPDNSPPSPPSPADSPPSPTKSPPSPANSPPSPPSPTKSPPSPPAAVTPPPPPTGAATVNGVGSQLAIALALGSVLMTFV